MNNRLEQTQFVLVVRTPNFQDSRSPFVDVTAVAQQRELRKQRLMRQRQRERLLKKRKQDLLLLQQQQHQHQQQHQQQSSNGGVSLNPASHPPPIQTQGLQSPEDEDEDEEENEEDETAGLTTQQLLSPNALFCSSCIVNGVSQLCEQLLKLYENEVMEERSRKALAVKEEKKRQQEQQERKEKAAEEQRARARQQALAALNASVSGLGEHLTSSVLPSPQKSQQQQQPAENSNNDQKSGGGAVAENNNNHEDDDDEKFEAELDKQFQDETNDLATNYPLEGIPPHYQYDGGIMFRFLESLPILNVFEYEESNRSGGAGGGGGGSSASSSGAATDEPRYVPHGLVWIKAQMLLYLEARAKSIEAPKEEEEKA